MHTTIPVLIPSYNPDDQLIKTVNGILALGFERIVIVNDGSEEASRGIFTKLATHKEVAIIHHYINLGKGSALKTGLNYCATEYPNAIGVVTADGDGQHAPEDIAKVAKELCGQRTSLILGSRKMAKDVPLKSRFGNTLTRYIFQYLIGRKLIDTQTGLRGIPRNIFGTFIAIPGDRYEYETNMLIACGVNRIPISEVIINTIYLDGNRRSHFNPILDSMRIYFLILRFAFSSLVAALIDLVTFYLVYKITSLAMSVALARLLASIANFGLNRNFVFHDKSKFIKTVSRYYLLLVGFGTISWASISLLQSRFGVDAMTAKVLTETLLFFVNFKIQRDYIFRHPSRRYETL
jgi:glycosyltransferase involved in cell wall biosynthesis